MRRHWQRKPLLVRGAVPELRDGTPLPPERLAEHAATHDVESRVVSRARGRWSVEHGPFDRIPSLRTRDWTLLVQGMDLVDDAAHAMLQRFRFVPDARLDDLMVSLATPGGGVGPHIDSYDVFLLQASGRRRWSIGPAPRPTMVPDLPLRILDDWQPTETFDVEPGDLLYLPPGWGHDGVAIDTCTTWSIGFRTPSRQEFIAAWLHEAAEQASQYQGERRDARFRDPGRLPTDSPARVPDDLRDALLGWVRAWKDDERAIERSIEEFVGRYLSEPKPHVVFDPPRRALGLEAFARRAQRHGVALDRRTRMLHDARGLHVNGETAPVRPVPMLRRLADARGWSAAEAARALADAQLLDLVHEWYEAGWLHLEGTKPAA